ncbi:MAG: AAA family ATPase [Pirellulaceae bacterium]|nr:AAA family ATPase [Pirellulaceae bacterium]
MDAPELIIFGGPNGAGKSTFAVDHAASLNIPYVGADAIAVELAPNDVLSVRIKAAELFLERIQGAVAKQRSLVIESTLAGKSLRRFVESTRITGYRISIVFVFLDSADTCVARVRQRVRLGGHDVPEEDVRRRFQRSVTNFWNIYRPLADFWMLVYNSGGAPESVAIGYEEAVIVRNAELFDLFQSFEDDHD